MIQKECLIGSVFLIESEKGYFCEKSQRNFCWRGIYQISSDHIEIILKKKYEKMMEMNKTRVRCK